jgi:hypothetical protein
MSPSSDAPTRRREARRRRREEEVLSPPKSEIDILMHSVSSSKFGKSVYQQIDLFSVSSGKRTSFSMSINKFCLKINRWGLLNDCWEMLPN